ncbi:MAG TPA: DUF488 domain-containing protein [Candidatus Saccharibacteria bacterium]|nr:DUF488 domain-containing protein [Candidatus Saccharibacteria bacterium]
MSKSSQIIYTVGHSTHPIDEFIKLLQTYGVEQLIDIRTVPGSRHNPQYGQKPLKTALKSDNISYIYMKGLGGLRHGNKESINMGWRNKSFRSYADYMQTPEFMAALKELISISKKVPTVIMCAEAVPWRCHRSLVGDALLVRGITVRDIISLTSDPEHKLTSFAKVNGTNITYPESSN